MSSVESSSPDASSTSVPVGEALRRQREHISVPLESVASQTNIPVHKLIALEQGDYDELGIETFIVGYLRKYAAVLSLPSDPLVEQYRQEQAKVSAEREALESKKREEHNFSKKHYADNAFLRASASERPIADKRSSSQRQKDMAPDLDDASDRLGLLALIQGKPPLFFVIWLIPVLVVLWVLLSWLIGRQHVDSEESIISADTPSAARVFDTEVAATDPSSNRPGLLPVTVDEELSSVNGTSANQPVFGAVDEPVFDTGRREPAVGLTESPTSVSPSEDLLAQEYDEVLDEVLDEIAVSSAEVSIDPGVTSSENVSSSPVSAGGDSVLDLSFTGDCWVEVEDAEGTIIYADLEKDGDTLRLSGKAPLKVLLGDASVASMRFNDKRIDTLPRGNRKIRRFVLQH